MYIAKIIENEAELQSIRQMNLSKRIIFTSGCFDLLHYGHICHLEESKSLGDLLVVAINSDESVKRLKGKDKPIIPEWQRIRILQAIRYVDYIFSFAEDDVCTYFNILKPDCFTIGEESAELFHGEIDAAYFSGSQVHVIKRVANFSSTNIINKIRKEWILNEIV